MREMPRQRARRVEGLGPRPRDAGRRRRSRCSATSPTRSSPTPARRRRSSRRDGKFFVNTDGPDGKLADYEIKYAFGVRPLQQYLIELPGGRMQALGIAWDSRPKAQGGQRWFHLYPGQNIKAGDPLHWTGIEQNWNFQCAECHSTNLRKNFDADDRHVRDDVVGAQRLLRGVPRARLEPRRLGEARRATGEALAAGKGLALALDERKGVALDAGRGDRQRAAQRAAHVGPRDRDVRALPRPRQPHLRRLRARQAAAGHAPARAARRRPLLERRPDARRGLQLGLVRAEQDARAGRHVLGLPRAALAEAARARQRACARSATCRRSSTPRSTRTTRRARRAPPARRATCRRRRTWWSTRGTTTRCAFRGPTSPSSSARRTRATTATRSRPRNGRPTRSPKWTGKAPASYQNFAEALRAGSVGAPGARGALLGADRRQGAAGDRARQRDRRGSAAWLTPVTVDAVARELNDPDPLVRLAAVEALANADARDAAALSAAHARRSGARGAHRGGARARRRRRSRCCRRASARRSRSALAEYVAAQTYNADRPEGRIEPRQPLRAARRRGRAPSPSTARRSRSIRRSCRPTRISPTCTARAAPDGEADAVLREGLARNPRAAVLHHALGLALVRQKRHAEGLKALAHGREARARRTPASRTSTRWR